MTRRTARPRAREAVNHEGTLNWEVRARRCADAMIAVKPIAPRVEPPVASVSANAATQSARVRVRGHDRTRPEARRARPSAVATSRVPPA